VEWADLEEVLPASDGVELNGWFFPPPRTRRSRSRSISHGTAATSATACHFTNCSDLGLNVLATITAVTVQRRPVGEWHYHGGPDWL
jgi:hypothetical protein